jgi:hypothetical protein
MYPVCTVSLANKPLEPAGMSARADIAASRAGRSAPIR